MTSERPQRGVVSRFVRRVGGSLKTGFAVVGIASAAALYNEYRQLQPAMEDIRNDTTNDSGDDTKQQKKKVLVIPFHRLQFIDHKTNRRPDFSQLSRDPHERTHQMTVKELVDLLHDAAADPDICALYGYFGHTGGGGSNYLQQTGWADLEEIRSALRVVRESHRRHAEPNLSYQTQVIPRSDSKPLFCYADSMESLGDPANKEYYLASIFTHIHLQQHAALNLWGLLSQQFFVRDALNKYGIGLHVFKHGEYKNAPNMFTEQALNRPHRHAVTSLLEDLNVSVHDEIARSRSEGLLTSWLKKQMPNYKKDQSLWKRIHEAGTFPAKTAWKAGLVDYIPRRDPLPDLLESNKTAAAENDRDEENGDNGDSDKENQAKDDIAKSWDRHETDFDRFKASEAISLQDYAKQRNKKRMAKARLQKWNKHAEKHTIVAAALYALGLADKSTFELDKAKPEKVALLYAQGESGINHLTARKLMHSIREIRKDKDVKAVVLRVNSPGGAITPCETIRQELAALDVPVIVSFGNVSASGGYYISAAADRIFASRKTITGSIGVFGIRMDLTEMAKQYGVHVDHVALGDLAATYSPFHPMSRKMRKLMGDSLDRSYAHFKDIVAQGRQLPDVEALAKGRVWTGQQAKDNGLVDELGGLHRAIAYAKRTYTKDEDNVHVVVWPREKSLIARLAEAAEQSNAQLMWSTAVEWARGMKIMAGGDAAKAAAQQDNLVDWILRTASSSKRLPGAMSGVMLTADENSAIWCLMNEMGDSPMPDDSFPPFFWE